MKECLYMSDIMTDGDFNSEVMDEDLHKHIEDWLQSLSCGGDVEEQRTKKAKFIESLRNPAAPIEELDVNQHDSVNMYEPPIDVVKMMFGKHLKFSCSYWPDGVNNIDEAEEASLALYCERAQVEDGQTVLDLGGGWGAVAFYLCEKYPALTVATLISSPSQVAYLQQQATERGYQDRLTVITADINIYQTTERYDRIFAVGIFEYVSNYKQLLMNISTWLRPDGFLFLQFEGHKSFPFHWDDMMESNSWVPERAASMLRGSSMPSLDALLYLQDHVTLLRQWSLSGTHSGKSSGAWRKRLQGNRQQIIKLCSQIYGEREALEFYLKWLSGCGLWASIFSYNNGNEFHVAHYLFKKGSTL